MADEGLGLEHCQMLSSGLRQRVLKVKAVGRSFLVGKLLLVASVVWLQFRNEFLCVVLLLRSGLGGCEVYRWHALEVEWVQPCHSLVHLFYQSWSEEVLSLSFRFHHTSCAIFWTNGHTGFLYVDKVASLRLSVAQLNLARCVGIRHG